ncbi:MAG TPA: universal stress protein, partial [Longimicrobiales bacterium]|nr:universal stress protein [Longimicrobiales bacterium]
VRAPRQGASEAPDALHPLDLVFAVDAGRPARRATHALPQLITTEHARAEALTVADEGAGGRLDEKEAGKVAERAARELGAHGLPTTTRVEVGPVAPAILEVAGDADLIVLGSRAVTEVERRGLGSVALEVARSTPCSVLILRRGPSAPAPEEGEAETVHEAGIPFELSSRNVEPSPAIEREVLRGIETLEWLAPDATRCDVMVERRHPRHQTGSLYHVRIDLSVPGEKIVVSRTPPEHRQAETVVTALVEAFRTARRRLLEAQSRTRGDVKHHEVAPHGVVSELFPDHGFIQGSDGRLVYFHRNSVLGDAWGHLEAGTEVRYVVEQGEQGPQASTVALVGKHHPVG